MIRILLKKQFAEIFKGYFFDIKKNKARSMASTIMYFALFALLIVVLMGSVFGMLAYSLVPIVSLGFGWFYYSITGLLAVLFGVFGSVFSTYSGLYLAKDNNLLLSLPIPVSAIMTSRLLGVYLMGLLYSAIPILPALIVRFIFCGFTAGNLIGGIVFMFLISLIVLALSCIFGYFVARISLKLKNKSFIVVLISIAFFAAYYYFYFNANKFLSELIANVALYGDSIKSKAYPVYIVGKAAEGELLPAVIVAAAVILILFVTLYVISRSFIKIVTSTSSAAKVTYKQKRQNAKSVSGALMSRELKRFTSSPNYMLNCGLGLLFMIAAGVFLIVKGGDVRTVFDSAFSGFEGLAYIIVSVAICFFSSLNDTAAPSVSLEGKTIWQIKALPVSVKSVLKSKYMLQVYLNMLPAVFFTACAVAVFRPDVLTGVLILLFSAVYVVFYSLYSLYCGLHKVNLNWLNEVVPIKQGMNVMFAVFGGWGYGIVMGGLYFAAVAFVGVKVYLAAWIVITLALGYLLYRWINTRGVRIFGEL